MAQNKEAVSGGPSGLWWLGVLSTTPLGPGRSGMHVGGGDAPVALSSVRPHSNFSPAVRPEPDAMVELVYTFFDHNISVCYLI